MNGPDSVTSVDLRKDRMPEQWLYEHNDDNSARYVLGTVGENPLVCFGVNPSTAEPNALDATSPKSSTGAT